MAVGYAEIAAHYRRLISDGELSPGDPMPSMREVCDTWKVSITTANRAFRQLKSEGLTEPKPGVGTVVATRAETVATGAARLDRLARTGRPYAHKETSTDHRAALRSVADPDIAEALGVEVHDEVVIRSRTFLHDGKASVIAVSVIHPRALGPVPELLQQEPLHPFWQVRYTERTGQEITRLPERRTARLALPHELSIFGIPETVAAPVLLLETRFEDEDGPIEVWQDVYAPGLWQVDGQ